MFAPPRHKRVPCGGNGSRSTSRRVLRDAAAMDTVPRLVVVHVALGGAWRV